MVYCRAASWVIKHRGAVSCGRIKSFNAILSARRKKHTQKKPFGFSDGGSKSGSAEVSSVCNSLRLPGPAGVSQCPLRLPNPPITGGDKHTAASRGGGAAAGSPASRLRRQQTFPSRFRQGKIFYFYFFPFLACCNRLQVCFIIGPITFFIALMGYLIDTLREDLPLLRRA